MAKILIVYYSSYGHIEAMAHAQAAGAARVTDTQAVVKRVAELCPLEVAQASGFKLDQRAPMATPEELGQYDAIIFGTPTRFGNMAAQMRNFLDQTGPLWASGALVGKIGSVFCSTASQHGGQETTITSFHSTLLHHGMIIVGLPYTFKDLATMREITGGTPYGASCVTGAGSELRMPTALELEMCRYQGEHVARITAQMAAGARRQSA
ncbi:MAG TPA: NAD(P)H:quinone oxidoreductase [Steroidobacteraceae bacterium]|jgi:NAD(P)H dehydrogenase (quinone)|nr:NAD(P)H:quinone oxidoreductase [Steroidobacteraceae bacterium]